MARSRHRLAREDGFTLIEVLCAIAILGTLLGIAVPSFLGFKARGDHAAAKADVRAALPAVEAYYSECGTYADATAAKCTDGVDHTFDLAGLKDYDTGLKLVTVKSLAGGTGYCIAMNVGGKTASLTGPGGTVSPAGCP